MSSEIPQTTKEANDWLREIGVLHLKFGTEGERPVVRDVITGATLIRANSVIDICHTLVTNKVQAKRFRIPKSNKTDWYPNPKYQCGTIELVMDNVSTLYRR